MALAILLRTLYGTWWASGLDFLYGYLRNICCCSRYYYVMLIARFWDMISDPIMGIIADRTNTRWGNSVDTCCGWRFHTPYWQYSPFPHLILVPREKVIYAGVTYLLLMTVFTAINLPYSSLGAVMTSNSYERAGLNSYRFIFAFAWGSSSLQEPPLTWPAISAGATTPKATNTPFCCLRQSVSFFS